MDYLGSLLTNFFRLRPLQANVCEFNSIFHLPRMVTIEFIECYVFHFQHSIQFKFK